jgi:hypothetical protein
MNKNQPKKFAFGKKEGLKLEISDSDQESDDNSHSFENSNKSGP